MKAAHINNFIYDLIQKGFSFEDIKAKTCEKFYIKEATFKNYISIEKYNKLLAGVAVPNSEIYEILD